MDSKSKPSNRFLHWSTWTIYGLLFSVSIPWYWPSEDFSPIWGIPRWVLVTIASSLLISSYTAWLLLNAWPADTDSQTPSDE